MFKYEMHLHTESCSACAVSTARDMVDAAKEHGYSGFALTNHFYNGNTAVERSLKWSDFIEAYNADYLEAKSYGEQNGITVFFGIEEVYESGKEMLIYGLSPQILSSCPEFKNMTKYEESAFVRENGGFVACAHPFRNRFYIPNPDREPDASLFDAIEGYNYFNKPQENEKAVEFAKKHSLPIISGGDVHCCTDFGSSGIATEDPIHSEKELLFVLRSGNYKIIVNGEIR